MDGEVRREEEVGSGGGGAFEELEDTARVVDVFFSDAPVPDSFVGGAEGEFEAIVFEVFGHRFLGKSRGKLSVICYQLIGDGKKVLF